MTENILAAFNGQLNLRVAYTFNRVQVLNFLDEVINQPQRYGVDLAQSPELIYIVAGIKHLSIHGMQYDVPGLEPPQHISRVINPSWNRPNPSNQVSKFQILKFAFHGIKYWSCADLLGLFLSSLGLAPNGATKRNFFLPLTAVYGRWCEKLCPTQPPVVFQCTWCERNDQATRFFLGASRSGYQAPPATTGTWRHVLNKARFYVLDAAELLNLAGWSLAWSPRIRDSGRRSSRFGYCGETYPFRILLRGHSSQDKVYGLALNKWYLRNSQTYDDRLSGNVWRSCWDPCPNCQELIRIWGSENSNENSAEFENCLKRFKAFKKWYGSDGAPP